MGLVRRSFSPVGKAQGAVSCLGWIGLGLERRHSARRTRVNAVRRREFLKSFDSLILFPFQTGLDNQTDIRIKGLPLLWGIWPCMKVSDLPFRDWCTCPSNGAGNCIAIFRFLVTPAQWLNYAKFRLSLDLCLLAGFENN